MDWNSNGKHDDFDDFMNMKMMNGELDENGRTSHSGGYLFFLAIMIAPIVWIGTMIGTVVMKL